MFDINVFGLGKMIRAVLPGMRKQRSGFIVNLASLAGIRSFPALSYYNATKFAVEGLSEALWQEVEPLGIRVMIVEPSGFRTDWAGRSANECAQKIDAYLPPPAPRSISCAPSRANSPGIRCAPCTPSSRRSNRQIRRIICCWAMRRTTFPWPSSTNCARSSRHGRRWPAARISRRNSGFVAENAGFSSERNLCRNRRVVGRAFALAHLAVYPRCAAAFGQLG